MATERIIRHVVFLQFKETATEVQIAEVEQAFLALPAQVPAIQHLEWGAAINDGASYTHCLMVLCRTEADLQAYASHPAHQAIPDRFGSLFAGGTEIDYWAEA